MKKYKVINKTEAHQKIGDIIFTPKETKILDIKPSSDRFEVEEIEKEEEKKLKKEDKN